MYFFKSANINKQIKQILFFSFAFCDIFPSMNDLLILSNNNNTNTNTTITTINKYNNNNELQTIQKHPRTYLDHILTSPKYTN